MDFFIKSNMLENYELDKNGIIKQINRNKFEYSSEYIKHYEKLDRNYSMSNLRLGNIIGSISKVPKSILDIGYGSGNFLETAKNLIPYCYGNDISGYTIPPGCEFVSDIFNQYFEVITFFDSLEHFDDIYFLNALKCNYIVISLPWCHYFDDDWFENWKHRKPDEHLWHFNSTSLTRFMKSQGFVTINITDIEDSIRKHGFSYSNILTGVFKKEKL